MQQTACIIACNVQQTTCDAQRAACDRNIPMGYDCARAMLAPARCSGRERPSRATGACLVACRPAFFISCPLHAVCCLLSVVCCVLSVVCCPLHVVVRCTLSVACCGSRCVHRGGDPVQRPRVHRLTRAHCGDGRFHRVVWDTVPCEIRCRARYRAARDVLQLYKAELRQEAKEELERLRVVMPYSGYSRLSKRDRGTVQLVPCGTGTDTARG
jgi:hypothetical protein